MLPQRRLAPGQDEMASTLMIPAPAGVDAESEHMRAALATSWRVADHSYSAGNVGLNPGSDSWLLTVSHWVADRSLRIACYRCPRGCASAM